MLLILYGLLIVAITVGLSLLGLFFTHRLFNPETLEQNNPVADPLLQVTGTLYAVLLGLLVVHAMDRFQESRINVENEAIAVADTYRLASVLPTDRRQSLQNNCLQYVKAVLNDEWNTMENPESCKPAWEALDKMWYDVISFGPQTPQEQYVYPALLEAAEQMHDCRRIRLVTCRTMVPMILWVVILSGGAITIIFTYAFGTVNRKGQMFMTGMCATILSLNIYLWSIYSNPFFGLLKVTPEAFEMDLEQFQYYISNPDKFRWDRRIEPRSTRRSTEQNKSRRPLTSAADLDNDDNPTKTRSSIDDTSNKKGQNMSNTTKSL
ncbi:MAG: DUF4239 domain-containing protein [Candidatus Obscuribacterales bacterium]|nr:DUF4239 domain-containing protein [Candidatus Obscuribacterales bacterium]